MLVSDGIEGLQKWLHEQTPIWTGTRTTTGGAPARRAAVIGADGFIGRRLVAGLQADGVQTIGYNRRHDVFWPDHPSQRPDVVFYLASSITPALAEQHPEWVTTDRLRFAALLAHLARSAHPPTVVLTSSGGTVYDPDITGACAETGPIRATCRYGQAKLELEELLNRYADAVPGVILRLSNVYGVGQRIGKSQGVLAYWLHAAAFGGELHLIGDPSTTRDYIYVDDVVACMRRLVSRPTAAGDAPLVLNVGAGTSTSLTTLLAAVGEVVGRELAVKRVPARSVDRREFSLDVRRAAELLGWRAHTSLTEGIAVMWRALLTEAASLGVAPPAYHVENAGRALAVSTAR